MKILTKRNGCTQKPSLYQLLTYLIYLPNIIFTYINLGMLEESVIHYVLYTLLNIASIAASLLTMLSDPTDHLVYLQQRSQYSNAQFDYGKHQLESYCDLCEAYVQENTKHCKTCDRCCQDFDHHCKWVNNCVGGINYKLFIYMIVSTFLQMSYSIIIHVRIIILYNSNPKQFNNDQTVHYNQQQDTFIKYIISIIYIALDSFILMLLIQLILFHIYIKIRGMSTYEFIVNRSNRQVRPQKTSDLTIFQFPSMVQQQQESNIELRNQGSFDLNQNTFKQHNGRSNDNNNNNNNDNNNNDINNDNKNTNNNENTKQQQPTIISKSDKDKSEKDKTIKLKSEGSPKLCQIRQSERNGNTDRPAIEKQDQILFYSARDKIQDSDDSLQHTDFKPFQLQFNQENQADF